ncbi:MAG: hypothetical protein ACREJS_06000 [Candidatus Rokuibacteriota bacterium]
MGSFIKKASVAGVALALFLLVGVVFAAWVVTGTGSGSARARQAQDLTTADASASTSAQLYPGATGDVRITIDNPNPFPVTVESIAKTAGSPITSDKGGACDASTGVTFTDQNPTSNNVVAASGQVTMTLNNAVSMDNTSANACQGAVFTIPVTITAGS